MTGDLREQVLAVVHELGPVSGNAVVATLGKRRVDVLAALRDLHGAGRILRRAEGWIDATDELPPATAPRVVPGAGNHQNGLTAAELYAMPRRSERVKAIWAAMSPDARERAWAALSDERRADAVAILFDAEPAL